MVACYLEKTKMMRVALAMLAWGVLTPLPGEAIVGYECGSSASNITTLSLLNVDECDIPQPVLNITTVHIQLLQIDDYASVHVRQCKIEISRDIRKCGMFSHTSDVYNGKASYLMAVSRESCIRMHEYGSVMIDKALISGLGGNESANYPLTLAGVVGGDGSCTGTAYSDPYGSWTEVIVQADVKVTLRDYQTRVGVKNNKVYLNSGSRCDLSKGYCMDVEGGPTFWESLPKEHCGEDKYSILYAGMAERAVNHDSRVMYSLTTSDVTFALTAASNVNVCGQRLVRTEHPRLLIHEVREGQGFVNGKKVDVDNMDIFAYINSKFVYVERHIRTQIQMLYYDVLVQRCSLEREMLRNRLAIATQAPDEFAYHLMQGPGYMAVISGEVVHIVKCIPMEVKVQHMEECYTQLPVTEGNQTYFMAPRTHVLMGTGVQVTCNKLVPPMYFIEGEWYGLSPGPMHVYPPETMKPMTRPTWRYKDTRSLATSGIYTSADLEQLREHVMFPAERPGVLNKIARGMMGKPTVSRGGSIANLLDGPDFAKLVESTWSKTWEKFMTFGHVSAGLIGIFMLVRGVKLIIDTLIHGYALHTVYGWSIYLIGAVWDSVTSLLLHLRRGGNGPNGGGGVNPVEERENREMENRAARPEDEGATVLETRKEASAPASDLAGENNQNAKLVLYPTLPRN